MLLGSSLFLAVALLYWLSAFVAPPKSDDELDRLDRRLDPDAHNQRQLEGSRQARTAVSWFLVPLAVLVFLYALGVTLFG